MPILKCEVFNCAYNIDKICAKEVINVGGENAFISSETICYSFINHKKAQKSLYKTEFASFINPKLDTKVNCIATNCHYNKSYICVAKRVEISKGELKNDNESLCNTFKVKTP